MRSVPFTKFFWSLMISMSTMAIVIMVVSLTLIYRAAYSDQLNNLEENVKLLASLIEAVAQFDEEHNEDGHPEGAHAATLMQVEEAISFQAQRRPSEELTIAYLEGDSIRLMRQAPSGAGIEYVMNLPNDGVLLQPQYHALKGQTGSGEMLDYLGNVVLAGYAPVKTLGIGLVYKIDLHEVRKPYFRAGLWTILITIGVIFMADWALRR